MPSPKTQPARGMRDFLPADVRKREYVIGVIKSVYERYGFEPLETPAVENIETLTGKYGEEGNQLIFKILKRGEHEKTGEADLALRYDLTVPLARVVAQYQNELPKFFKRYQIQPVWRADRPARGRFREFYQCDVDVLGSQSMVVEAELCSAVSEVLQQLGFTNFIIRVNHRELLNSMLSVAGLPSERHSDALVVIDKLDKIGVEGVERELSAKGLTGEGISSLLSLLLNSIENAHDPTFGKLLLPRIARFIAESAENKRDWEKDLGMFDYLVRLTPAARHIRFDPSLARGLSYYTGVIMEINVPDLSGSLGGGGRYDNLVGMFLGRNVPACGFSLGLERIIVVMNERGMFPATIHPPADILVTMPDAESAAHSLAVANELRREGMRVDLYPEPDKLKKQFGYAAMRGIPEVVIVGSEERAQEIVSVKDMQTGNQRHEMRVSWKRKIFSEFLEGTGMNVDLNSIRTSEILGPDFCCEIDGNTHYFKLTEIVDEDVARNYNISLKTMEPRGGAFSQEEPLRKVFRTRASKPYHTGDAPVELVAYYDKQYPPTYDLTVIPRTVGRTAEFMIESGGWARIWVYDTWNKDVLWTYPSP